MKRRKQEKVTTYISTLTVNFGNNQSTKSKTHSKSHNLPSKEQHVRSSTSYHSDVSQSYRQAQKSSETYYQLIKSTPPNRSNGPELKKEAQKHSSFQNSKNYFEELSTKSGDAGSWSKSYSSRDEKQPKYNSYSSKEVECDKPLPPTTKKWEPYENEVKSEASTSVSSVKTLYSPKKKSSNSSASSVTKMSTGNRMSKKPTTTTTTTTTTIEEKQILSSAKTEVTSIKPETDYGETDWYLDILLRIQSLEMKQQNLHTQYDFLGKLAKENREDLKLSRDWARYNVDNYEVEAY